MLVFLHSVWWWEMENQCPSDSTFVSWVCSHFFYVFFCSWCSSGVLWNALALSLIHSLSTQDRVCWFLPDESHSVGGGLLGCRPLWHPGGHFGPVVWHLCAPHILRGVLWLQKTCKFGRHQFFVSDRLSCTVYVCVGNCTSHGLYSTYSNCLSLNST